MKGHLILSTGGTGGHVFPALSLAADLKKRGFGVDLITDQRGAVYQESHQFDQVSVLTLPKAIGIFGKLRQGMSILCQALNLVRHFRRHRPDLVVGFGGYTSAPVVVAAVMLRIPIIIHEQNAVLGRVNRLMGKFARHIALGMPIIRHANGPSTTFVGNPVRQEILDARCDEALSDQVRLFVFGGSQGANLFARVVPQAVALLPESLQKRLVIIHQVREELNQQTRQAYQKTQAHLKAAQAFFSDMPHQLAQANLIIGRAGAMTVTEIATIGRAALFIPLKIALDNHQYWNVKPLVDAGAAEMILEEDVTPESLGDRLKKLIESQDLRHSLATGIKKFSVPDAASRLADLIERELGNRNGLDY
jgi:UDP-N-acetylglucosamine--N-acetylmuramyl-(pentapeptide) pyrophosphoryl-undecaprenol N-acetylglucosamine transferase